MTHIHYFPRYSQKENFCTNNSLLLMYRLYQFNQLRFEKFLKILLTDAATDMRQIHSKHLACSSSSKCRPGKALLTASSIRTAFVS